MSGVLIAGGMLRADAAVIALVAAPQIKAWLLPQGGPIPSIVVTRVSRTQQQLLARPLFQNVTERVQVTVRASTGSQREAILKCCIRACVDRTGTIGGYSNVAVLFAGGGPDFMDDAATIFMGSFDLRVSFTEPA